MSQLITAGNISDFMDVIVRLVKEGITFEADVTKLEIRPTGGY